MCVDYYHNYVCVLECTSLVLPHKHTPDLQLIQTGNLHLKSVKFDTSFFSLNFPQNYKIETFFFF